MHVIEKAIAYTLSGLIVPDVVSTEDYPIDPLSYESEIITEYEYGVFPNKD